MKHLMLAATLAFCAGCGLTDADRPDVVNHRATIMERDDIYVLVAEEGAEIVPGSSGSVDLYASNLPDRYRKDGLRVLFSADLLDCPPRAYCYGQLVQITQIRRLWDMPPAGRGVVY